jgi:hypothetical protein
VPSQQLTEQLLHERVALAERVHTQRDQLERLRRITNDLEEQLSRDEHLLIELDGVLGIAAQLRIESLDNRLRGQRLEEVAVHILRDERGPDASIHYRDWYELVRARGHRVGGKNPLNTFLAQINRSRAVESVGRRTGRYRLTGALTAAGTNMLQTHPTGTRRNGGSGTRAGNTSDAGLSPTEPRHDGGAGVS